MEEIVHCEGGEALAQVSQRICGCPIPGNAQDQVQWGLEQPGIADGVPGHREDMEWDYL